MPAAERVTVTLRADLLEQIDRVERNRSRFIAQAVEHELDRRRREALLVSITARRIPKASNSPMPLSGIGSRISRPTKNSSIALVGPRSVG